VISFQIFLGTQPFKNISAEKALLKMHKNHQSLSIVTSKKVNSGSIVELFASNVIKNIEMSFF